MKSFPILVILALSLLIFSCRETFSEQQKDIDIERKLPALKNSKAADSLPGLKEVKPKKPAPSKKKLKDRDTLKPKIAELHQLE